MIEQRAPVDLIHACGCVHRAARSAARLPPAPHRSTSAHGPGPGGGPGQGGGGTGRKARAGCSVRSAATAARRAARAAWSTRPSATCPHGLRHEETRHGPASCRVAARRSGGKQETFAVRQPPLTDILPLPAARRARAARQGLLTAPLPWWAAAAVSNRGRQWPARDCIK